MTDRTGVKLCAGWSAHALFHQVRVACCMSVAWSSVSCDVALITFAEEAQFGTRRQRGASMVIEQG